MEKVNCLVDQRSDVDNNDEEVAENIDENNNNNNNNKLVMRKFSRLGLSSSAKSLLENAKKIETLREPLLINRDLFKLIKIGGRGKNRIAKTFLLFIRKGSQYLNPEEHFAEIKKICRPGRHLYKCLCGFCRKSTPFQGHQYTVESHIRQREKITLRCCFCSYESFNYGYLRKHIQKLHWDSCFALRYKKKVERKRKN